MVTSPLCLLEAASCFQYVAMTLQRKFSVAMSHVDPNEGNQKDCIPDKQSHAWLKMGFSYPNKHLVTSEAVKRYILCTISVTQVPEQVHILR